MSRDQGITYLYGHCRSARYPVAPACQVVRDMFERGVAIAIEDRMIEVGLTGRHLIAAQRQQAPMAPPPTSEMSPPRGQLAGRQHPGAEECWGRHP